MENSRWDYGSSFQIQVLGLCLRDPEFLSRYADVIDHAYFEQQDMANLAMLVLRHFRKEGEVPKRDTVVFKVREFSKKYDRDGSDGLEKKLLHWLDHVYSRDLDENFIADRIVKFGQRQAIRLAMYESVDLLQSPPSLDEEDDLANKVSRKIEEACQKGTARDFGLRWHDVALNLPYLLQNSVTAKSKVPIGISYADKLMNGGPGAGELAVVMGPPNKGKSTFLCGVGANASYFLAKKAKDEGTKAKAVVHITCEMSELATMSKYAASTVNISINEVKGGHAGYETVVSEQLPLQAPLYVKHFLPGKTTVDELKWFIANLVMVEEVDVGMVIVDYADRLRGGEDDRFRGMGAIYDGLIEISKKFACPVWTGTQVRRFNAKDELIDETGAAESWKKVEACDIMVSLNQTNDEYEHGCARLNFSKIRDGEAKRVVPVIFRQSHCQLRDMSDNERKEFDSRATTASSEVAQTTVSSDPGRTYTKKAKPIETVDTNDLHAMMAEAEARFGDKSQ